MRTLHFRSVERRRTVRVTLCVDLIVQGSTENNGAFKIKARTLSVSRHGGMMVMDPEVAMGQKLVLINMNSGEKAECQVVATKTARDGKRHIGFKFMSAVSRPQVQSLFSEVRGRISTRFPCRN